MEQGGVGVEANTETLPPPPPLIFPARELERVDDIEAAVGIVLPYLLVGTPQYSDLALVPGCPGNKLIFSATDDANGQRRVCIKFTMRAAYPKQVGIVMLSGTRL